MARADEPPALYLGLLLQHEKGPKQEYSGLDVKELTKDDKGAQTSKGIQCKLSRDNPEKVNNIHNERIMSKS